MKIGFDVSQTGQSKAGCGYFADSLISHLSAIDQANEYLLYKTFGDSFWDSQLSEVRDIKQTNFKTGLKHSSYQTAKSFWQNLSDSDAIQLGQPDIIHANNFFCPQSKISNIKLVYTLYDLSFLEYPDSTTETNRITCFNGVFNASLNADFIIAISEYSRQHFLNTFPHYPADKIKVVYPASRFLTIASKERPERLSELKSKQFWLCVGTLEPRKNHYRLLQAYAKLKAQVSHPMPLVLAGGEGWMMEDFKEMLAELDLQQDVIWLGYVNDIELNWLYGNCFSLVYPTLFEGFGLPVLEAMNLGAPVITSNVSSLPEIVGSSGVMIDPLREDDIFQAMHDLMTGKTNRSNLIENSRQQARKFSWERTAKSVLEIYQSLIV